MNDRHARLRRQRALSDRRPSDGFRALSSGQFERLVARGVAQLPRSLRDRMDNVEILVEDVPPPIEGEDGVLLGLYEGVPATHRSVGDPHLPDRITIYRRPLELRARSFRDLQMLVAETVIHEIAHHFGIDDDRLGELGWD